MTRFVRFNVVGIAGFIVQVTALIALDRMGLPVVPATALAVEAAILHNFAWHERWTWAGMTTGSRAGRLARFHLSNGIISIAGNIVVTSVLAHGGAPLVVANVAAVLTCSLLNFAAAHVWVFCAKTWPTFHGHLQ
jgi:putative flippase GtrA